MVVQGCEWSLPRTGAAQLQTSSLLLVEDEAIILDFLGHALTEAGFDVVVASSGVQAVAELEANAARFRAVVTDVKLGGKVDGWDIGHRVRELVSDMPVVYMSGNSGHEWSSKGVPNSVFVAKPFVSAQVITAISTLLNEVDAHR
jgi:DNA-binding response OmpR family regulator